MPPKLDGNTMHLWQRTQFFTEKVMSVFLQLEENGVSILGVFARILFPCLKSNLVIVYRLMPRELLKPKTPALQSLNAALKSQLSSGRKHQSQIVAIHKVSAEILISLNCGAEGEQDALNSVS